MVGVRVYGTVTKRLWLHGPLDHFTPRPRHLYPRQILRCESKTKLKNIFTNPMSNCKKTFTAKMKRALSCIYMTILSYFSELSNLKDMFHGFEVGRRRKSIK